MSNATAATAKRPDATPATADALNLFGPLLIASDGTASSRTAVEAAAQLATHTETQVVVLNVVEPMPLLAADYGLIVPPVQAEESRRNALFERVKAQVNEVARHPSGWTVELREGDPPATIARTANEIGARMIVTGLGHHDLIDRLFGGETALHALRLARVPVFAVAPDYKHLPRRVIIATDFSVASVRAARLALQLFDTITMVYLVHVAPRLEVQPEAFAAWMSLYGENVGPAFERVKAELGFAPGITVETITRQGKPSREILDFARSANVDTIITGSRGAGMIDRILVGSTATGIIRGAHCNVLAVPTVSADERPIGVPEQQKVSLAEERWAEELNAFTKRNAGRRAALEVDDPELGAQAQEHDYPFLGAAYDHHDRRVELMLGDFEGVQRHLTRGITNVRSIDVLRDEHGRDWILRISHGRGQTILTLAK
ncbi:MAG TPA: universal stress protein [Gemmatimonadaceae bacterium]|nr:universal stress protein [Gemmatimonadaceae bacterium]